MSAPAKLVGQLTVKIIRCADLHRTRIVGKSDPYVKVNCGGEEKYKTHVAKDQGEAPVFEQAFLFNLSGKETDLHFKVYDEGTISDTWVGRFDVPIYQLLQSGGAAQWHNLVEPEEFRKIAGRIEFSVSFQGTGGPQSTVELAPITGPFHFQHNSTGFLLHASSAAEGAELRLAAGGLHDLAHAFEWQGPYIRSLANKGLYLTAGAGGADGVSLQSGISEGAKWRWTGVGLQSPASGKTLHPRGDAAQAGVAIHLASGSNAASGFSLIECKSTQQPAMSPVGTGPSLASAAAAAAASAHGHSDFDMDRPSSTWPNTVTITAHPHPLTKVAELYQGTYNCDVCKLQGQGTGYHCSTCDYDSHPACAKKHIKH